MTPKSFICKHDDGASEFTPSSWPDLPYDKELIDLWDFGYFVTNDKNQTKYVSYNYHHPFGDFALTTAHEPTMAVMADRSPWLDPTVDRIKAWANFRPDVYPYEGNATQAKMGNSRSYKGEGQNVLFLDSHVSFEKRAYVGIENDNIYTMQYEDDPNSIALGKRPVPYDEIASQPRSRRDSVLLQEPGRGG